MIDREKWAQIYDMARYNGFSPLTFILRAWENRSSDIPMYYGDASEEALYEACLAYSKSRTDWPSESIVLHLTCPTCGQIDECDHDASKNPAHTRILVRPELAEKWKQEYEEKKEKSARK